MMISSSEQSPQLQYCITQLCIHRPSLIVMFLAPRVMFFAPRVTVSTSIIVGAILPQTTSLPQTTFLPTLFSIRPHHVRWTFGPGT